LSDDIAATTWAAHGPSVDGVPLWEIVIVLGLAAGVIAVALRRRPQNRAAELAGSDEAAIAVVDELHAVDRALSTHANGVLTLSAVAAGAFATVIQTNGGPGTPLIFATAIALLTGCTIAGVGFAMVGEVTGVAALPAARRSAAVERNLRRVHRRAQCVRAATWCLFPIVLLVVICIAVVRR
jgi:hypothetical protein